MLYQAEFPEGFRAAASLRGFDIGVGRQPMSEQQRNDLTALRNTLQCLLSEHGFTDQPLNGCAPSSLQTTSGLRFDAGGHAAGSLPTAEDVSAIVERVVKELRSRGIAGQ